MKAKILLLVCIALLFFLVSVGAENYLPTRTTWEYKILDYPTENELNKWGADGWELAGAIYHADSNSAKAFLKRPK